jgi:N-acetylmuramic acid 6-phosphate (MurNAc-6-P) etherase
MVKMGKVMSNLMVDLHPSNAKLRDRAARIVEELTGADHPSALHELESCRWIVKKAVARLRRKKLTRAS